MTTPFLKFETTMDRVRSIGSWEAVSYLLLLSVAMPLKYIWHWEYAVKVVGMAHGILWLAYIGSAINGQMDYKWSTKTTCWLFVASLLPFGPFIADRRLLRQVPHT